MDNESSKYRWAATLLDHNSIRFLTSGYYIASNVTSEYPPEYLFKMNYQAC